MALNVFSEHAAMVLTPSPERRFVVFAAIWRFTLVAALFASAAHAAIEEKQLGLMKQAFSILSSEESLQAAAYLNGLLKDTSLKDKDWQTFFTDGFEPAWYTQTLERYWEYAITSAGEGQEHATSISVLCSAASAGRALAYNGIAGQSAPGSVADLALARLQLLSPRLRPQDRTAVLALLEETMAKTTEPIFPEPESGADENRMALRLALLAGIYTADAAGGQARVSSLLHLPPRYSDFWQKHALFLFDNGALADEQVESLDMLLSVIPVELHRIVAVIVPEATGINSQEPGVQTPGQLVFIPAIPLSQTTNAAEFTARSGQPVASDFTVFAAQQISRAIQAEQLERRPGLAVQRDWLLRRAGSQQDRYLRKTVPAAFFQQNPDELLPSIAVLWFIDTRATFKMAKDLLDIGVGDPMDTFMLVADLFSDGSDTTPIFKTDTEGRVIMNRAPLSRIALERVAMPPPSDNQLEVIQQSLTFASSIAFDGRSWNFKLNSKGSITGLISR